MFNSILLVPAADGSGQPVVKRAIEVAAPSAHLEVFRPVYEPLLEGYMGRREVYEPLRQRLLEERRQAAEAIARDCEARGLRASAKALWERAYDQAIAREAIAAHADLVIAEPSRGRDAGFGQQDWRMLSVCPAPVLVVKSDAGKPYRRIVAAVDPLHEHAKPAELDAAILELAKAFQAAARAELRVVHCFTPLTDLALRGAEHVPLEDAERALEEARRRELARLVAAAGLPAGSAEIVPGQPTAVLRGLVDRDAADLIVMGGLSRGRIRDLLIGSTAERLLRHSSADVVVVKPPGFEVAVATGA